MQIYDALAPSRSAPELLTDDDVQRCSGVKQSNVQLDVLSRAASSHRVKRVTTFERVVYMSHSVAIISLHSVGLPTLVERFYIFQPYNLILRYWTHNLPARRVAPRQNYAELKMEDRKVADSDWTGIRGLENDNPRG